MFADTQASLATAFADHLTAVEATNASPRTLKLYKGRHRQFLTYLAQQGEQPPYSLLLLNAANVRRAAIWIRERSRGKRGGEAAARALVCTLKTTSAWLTDEGYTEVDLIARVPRPRVTTIARIPFTQAEVRQLVAAALDGRQAERDIAIIHLLLDTGMRVGSLCAIRLGQLRLHERTVEVTLKGGRIHLLYFGTPDRRDGGRTVRALRAYLTTRRDVIARWIGQPPGRQDHGCLFVGRDGWPLQEDGVRNIMARLGSESGVSHVIPHRFRHTFATWYLIRHPGDETGLRGILGHLSNDMYRTYVHMAHEIVAARAGRVALSEAWLGTDAEAM